MKFLKIITKAFLFTIVSFFVLMFIFTLLNYFNLINSKVMVISKIVIFIFSIALGGYIMGKNALKNGWFEGLKLGLVIGAMLLIFNLVLSQKLIFKDAIFFGLLLISSMFGAMVGINKKSE